MDVLHGLCLRTALSHLHIDQFPSDKCPNLYKKWQTLTRPFFQTLPRHDWQPADRRKKVVTRQKGKKLPDRGVKENPTVGGGGMG
jgi:hypothetical protein